MVASLIFMSSSIMYSLLTLTTDGVTSFLQLMEIQNVCENTHFSLQDGGIEGFVHIFLYFLRICSYFFKSLCVRIKIDSQSQFFVA